MTIALLDINNQETNQPWEEAKQSWTQASLVPRPSVCDTYAHEKGGLVENQTIDTSECSIDIEERLYRWTIDTSECSIDIEERLDQSVA